MEENKTTLTYDDYISLKVGDSVRLKGATEFIEIESIVHPDRKPLQDVLLMKCKINDGEWIDYISIRKIKKGKSKVDNFNTMKQGLKVFMLGIIVLCFTLWLAGEKCVKVKLNQSSEDNVSLMDYSDISKLDSLIELTPFSNDTLLFGFTIGMTEQDFFSQINKLREGKFTIKYWKSALLGGVTLKKVHSIKLPIYMVEHDDVFYGEGHYIIKPHYTIKDKLYKLEVISIEKWDENSSNLFSTPHNSWLISKITSKPIDTNLELYLIANNKYNYGKFLGIKNNVLIVGTGGVFNLIVYTAYKSFLINLYKEECIKEKTKKFNEDFNLNNIN